jgi:hypothetical protein
MASGRWMRAGGARVFLVGVFTRKVRSRVRHARSERVSHAAVAVTSDYGVAPSFPGIR